MKPTGTREADGDYVDLAHFYQLLSRNRWWILICVLTMTAAAIAVVLFSRPVYRVTAILTPVPHGREIGGSKMSSGAIATLASGLGIGGPRNENAQEALAVLRSRAFTEKFIIDDELMQKLYPNKWNAKTKTWSGSGNERPTLSHAYEYFRKKIGTITNDRHTGLIDLEIEWKNPQTAAKWSRDLIDQLNQEMRARAIRRADASLAFLKAQLTQTSSVEIRNALAYLIEAQLKRRVFAQVTPEYALRFVAPPIGNDGAQPVWPRKTLLLVLGPIVGVLLGIVSTLLWKRA